MNYRIENKSILKGKLSLLLLGLTILFNCNLRAQNLAFDHLAVEDGLAQSVILDIFQDSEGYMWFGTQSGLSRYNGYEFVNYYTNPFDNTSLINTWIYDITEDDSGNIYLATKGGLCKYEKSSGEFSLIPHKMTDCPIVDNFVYGITTWENFLYVNIPPALTIINLETEEMEAYYSDFEYEGALHDLGSPIIRSSDNLIWIGTHHGLYSFNPVVKRFTKYEFPGNYRSIQEVNNITSIYEEKNGDILAGTGYGIFKVNRSSQELENLSDIEGKLSNNFIRAILRDKKDNLWIATEGGGLNQLRTDDQYRVEHIQYFPSDRNFVSHDILYSLLIDHSENLWVGSLAGIDKTDLKETGIDLIANTDDPLSYKILDNVIASVYIDDTNRLWVGNWGKGLNIIDSETDEVIHYKSEFPGKRKIPEDHIHVIFEDSQKKIWIGTRDGVSIYIPDDGSFLPVHEYFSIDEYDCFNNIRVYCMEEDRNKRIWIGTGNGVVVLDPESENLFTLRSDSHPPLRIRSNLVYSILEDSEGDIWIATSQGINRMNSTLDSNIEYYNDPNNSNSMGNNFAISLFEDHYDNIWIGTGTGLNSFSKKDSLFRYYSIGTGLPSNIIYDIIEDHDHNLWFSTGRGIATIDPVKLENPEFRVIDKLRGQEFNIKAVFRSKDGKLYFGGMNGVVSFYPDSLKRNRFIPPVKITHIEKENDGQLQSLNAYNDRIVLSYRDYSFTIEFSALDYTSPEKNRYMFQMIGLSDNWINLGTRRFVHFTNLPPGSYTFNVKGSNNDGIMNQEPTTLDIIIKPPWWKSSAAYVGYVFLFILGVIVIIYLRERNLVREKRILEEKVRIRTSEIARQKKLAEESELRLRSTVNSLDDLMFVLDEKGNFQEFYNPRKRKTHLIFPELHAGKNFKDIGLPEDLVSEIDNAYKVLLDKDEIIEFDHHFSDDGIVYWFSTKISPKRNPDGKLSGIVILARDITDRKEAEEKLARQKEELNELNITKDKFFSILAHDLKNPFTNLYSMGDLLIKNYEMLDEEEKFEALKKMYKSSEFIYNLLENLLTWSRTQRGKIDFNPAPFDLSKSVETNINLHRAPAETKGIMIENQVSDNLLAFGDRQMINTVIRNILNNAVKFTPKEGKIFIDVKKKPEFYEVSIEDQGIGITEENLNKLFRLDVKFKSTGTAGETGTGLGLVLCKEFVEKNHGKIWCESKPGEGTTFRFTVPVKS